MNKSAKFIRALSYLPVASQEHFWQFIADSLKKIPDNSKFKSALNAAVAELRKGRTQPRPGGYISSQFRQLSRDDLRNTILNRREQLVPFIEECKDWRSRISHWVLLTYKNELITVLDALSCPHDGQGCSRGNPPELDPEEAIHKIMALSKDIYFTDLEIITAGLLCNDDSWHYLEPVIDCLHEEAQRAGGADASSVIKDQEPVLTKMPPIADDPIVRVQNIRGLMDALIESLESAVTTLRAGRLPDVATITNAMDFFQLEFTDLVNEFQPDDKSLEGLKAALKAREGLTQALALIERLERLRHRLNPQFAELPLIRQYCAKLRQRIAKVTHLDETIIIEIKPLYALERLVKDYANMDEAAIQELDTEVRSKLSLQVVIAASKGNLEFAQPDEADPTAPEEIEAVTKPKNVEAHMASMVPIDTTTTPESTIVVGIEPSPAITTQEDNTVSDDQPSSDSEQETAATQKEDNNPSDELGLDDDNPPLADPAPESQPTSAVSNHSTSAQPAGETSKAEVKPYHKSDKNFPRSVNHQEFDGEIGFQDFSVNMDISTFCFNIRKSQGDEKLTYINGLLWKLVCDNRVGLAAHLADVICNQYGQKYCAVHPDLLRAIVLSATLQNATGIIAERLRELISNLFALNFDPRIVQQKTLVAIYALAATLRPSLVAPDTTGAHDLLSKIPLGENLDALYQLRQTILDYRRFGFAQNPAFLRMAHEMNSWQEMLADVEKKASTWWVSNRQRSIRFEPATHIWQHWLKPEQSLGRILAKIANGGTEAKSEVESIVTQWKDSAYVKRVIKETDKEIRGEKARIRPIEGDSLQNLLRSVSEMMELPKEWLAVISAHPEGKTDGLSRSAQEWRDKIQSIAPECLKELDGFSEQAPDSLQTQAAVLVAKRAVEGFISVLRDGPRQVKVSWYHALNGELLHLEEPPRSEDWDLKSIPSLDQILYIAEKTDADWPETLDRHIRRCDQIISRRVVEYLEAINPENLDIDNMVIKQTESVVRCRGFLDECVADLRNKIEYAVMLGQLAERDHIRSVERLEKAAQPNIADFRAELDELDKIGKSLEQGRKAQIREVHKRLEITDIHEKNLDVFHRIVNLLDQGDTLTANEYIALAENGQAIPESPSKSDPFVEFFPEQVAKLNRYLADQSPRTLVESIKAGKDFGPISMRDVPGSQRLTAASMLETWLFTKDRRGSQESNIRDFLNNFGFQVESVAANNAHIGSAWFDVRVRPISDRDSCVIPRYGSLAHGHYRLLCVWNAPSEGEVITLARPLGRDLPTLVLYLSRMTEQRRRDLAYQCRERRQTVLIIDETLVYMLCSARGPRLPLLFYCTFPFTVENPYTIASSNVPVEMFFGRKQERESLLDPYGSNLLYGGRQLGKTALLREVERENHAPDAGFIVHWIDLKAEGIGQNRPASDIWDVIGTNLRNDGVVQKQITSPEKTREKIIDWLTQDTTQRRILLLLDEADGFLFQDSSRKYETLAKLKDLMDRTGRRFKIVLAGLHNVQRSARDVNTPIAHMGQPVCIGPLLDNGEVQEALRLITLPFSTLGYRFDRDVASRILSHTNYYPSLIQIFCWHLLEHLNDNGRTRFDRSISPPYQITIQHVEEAYQRKELRNAIAERFRFTLELDGRYRLIALRIALETLEWRKSERDTSEGFGVDWIRTEALGLWPKGFDEKNYETFRNLLDEMIGLGILRRTSESGNKYALRSPNVINLLGTAEEIEEALLDAAEKEPPLVYDASSYRRYLLEDHWVLSPLTGQQESEIMERVHGVNVIFGMRISGLERVKIFIERLEKSLPNVCVSVIQSVNDIMAFTKALNSEFTRPDDNWEGVNLIVVDREIPWTEHWVLEAANAIGKRRTRRVFHRVLFIGDPAAAWHWMMIDDKVQIQLEKLSVKPFGLQPWKDDTLRRWMENAGFGPVNDHEQRRRFTDATGNWGEILHELGVRIRSNPAHWQEYVKNFYLNIDWLERVGLKSEARSVLKVMHEYGDALVEEEIEELLEPEYQGLLPQVLQWADLLSIVQAVGRKAWRVDRVIGSLLAQSEK